MTLAPTSDQHSDRLVQRVNELYHDLLGDGYEVTCRDIEHTEGERWRQCARRFLQAERPLRLIEIGTGTGFVPQTVGPLLKPADRFACSDISQGILDTARAKIEQAGLPCPFEFRKIEAGHPYRLPFESAEADAAMMNSVLHHLADTDNFLAEVGRVVKPGGVLIIAHEPNRLFYRHGLLNLNYRLLDFVLDFKRHVVGFGRRTGTLGLLRRAYYFFLPGRRAQMGLRAAEFNRLTDQLNRQLIAEGLLERPLSIDEINALVDYRADVGFDPENLLPNWRLEWLETYNHILTVSSTFGNRGWIRAYDGWLARRYPRHGAIFFSAWRKPGESA